MNGSTLAPWAGSICKEKDVCMINNLTASPLTLTMITSQNNGSFCWGQLQADLIVVSGKRLSQHPNLFFITTTTELFCQLQRSKSLNYFYAKKLYFPWKTNPSIIGHHTVELPRFTGTSWRSRSKILRKKFWKLLQMHCKYSSSTYLWLPASDHFQSNSLWCLHPSLSRRYDK